MKLVFFLSYPNNRRKMDKRECKEVWWVFGERKRVLYFIFLFFCRVRFSHQCNPVNSAHDLSCLLSFEAFPLSRSLISLSNWCQYYTKRKKKRLRTRKSEKKEKCVKKKIIIFRVDVNKKKGSLLFLFFT